MVSLESEWRSADQRRFEDNWNHFLRTQVDPLVVESDVLLVHGDNKPGSMATIAKKLGDAGINIATFHVGRDAPGGNAIALIEIDGEMPADVLAKVRALPQVQSAKPLKF